MHDAVHNLRTRAVQKLIAASIDPGSALKIERIVATHARGRSSYAQRVRAILYAMHDPSSYIWARKVRTAPTCELIWASPHERAPAIRAEILDAIQDKANCTIQRARVESVEQCRACKSRNLTVNLVQTRSADEAMTQFWYCGDCGKRWKI